MSNGQQYTPNYPVLPSSLSAGNQDVQGLSSEHEVQRSVPNTAQDITPYLGLRSRLSQVWINRWTILIFLILVRILLAIVGLNHDLGSAKTEAMSACSGVESMGSAMASMPHYLSAGVNELAASGVEKAIHALMSMLLLTITGVEELIVFYINMLTSTYLCLITLAVSSSLHVALKVVEDAGHFINDTIKGITTDINHGIDDFQNDLNKFTKTINSIPQAFGDNNGIPTININDSLAKLNTIQLPNLDQNLTMINNSIPTFQDVQNFTDGVIRLPFEEVKKLVNGSLKYTFDRSVLPVPEKEQMTFCSDNNGIKNFFDGLANVVQLARRVFIAVLVILAILVCIPMAYQEIRRWRTMQERAKLVGDQSLDSLDVIYIASRPYTATAGIKAASPFESPKKQKLTRWVVAYATSTPALLVLSLAITGLVACLCQYILLKAVEKEVPALANEVGDFADQVVRKLNNASATWANNTNGVITHENNNINQNIFGWVNTTTGAVNETLNAFINQTTEVLNATFGGTVLYDPITELFNCLVGLKVAGIQKGLTWVSDNAQVDFPLLPNDTFSLGAANSIAQQSTSPTGASTNGSESFLASPGSKAADQITNAVVKVTSHLADAIRTEAIISTCILLLYIIIVLLGVGRAVYLFFRREKVRAEGGAAELTSSKPQRPFMSIIRGPAPAYDETLSPTSANTGNQPSRRPFQSFSQPMQRFHPYNPTATTTANRSSTAKIPTADDNNTDPHNNSTNPFDDAHYTHHQNPNEGAPYPTASDEKSGHAGFREPATEQHPNLSGWEADAAGRRSVYPTVEKS